LNTIKVVVVDVIVYNDVVGSIVIPAGVATIASAEKENCQQHI